MLPSDKTTALEAQINLLRKVRDSQPESEHLRQLITYWETKRAGDSFPSRNRIDPLELRTLLGKIILFDVSENPLRFRFRLVGTDFVHWFGLDPTNFYVDEYPRPNSRDFIQSVLQTTFEWREPTTLRRSIMIDDRVCNYEAVYLPLSTDGNRIDMILLGLDMA